MRRLCPKRRACGGLKKPERVSGTRLSRWWLFSVQRSLHCMLKLSALFVENTFRLSQTTPFEIDATPGLGPMQPMHRRRISDGGQKTQGQSTKGTGVSARAQDAMKSTLTFASLLALGLMCMEAAAWTPPAALRAAAPRQRAACAQLRMTGGTSVSARNRQQRARADTVRSAEGSACTCREHI